MSRTNLLQTNTVSFLDLIGNGKTFKVPPYQRDYSWTDEQWEDLWLDVLELVEDADKRHYMGATVLKGENDRTFLIIDGQQRLATLSILTLAVIKKLTDLANSGSESTANLERATALRNRYIGEKDPASLLEVSKLVLNEHDNGFFQDYLVQIRPVVNPRSLSKSNKQLWDCFNFFDRKLSETEFREDGLRLASFVSEVMARRLLFIQILVEDEVNAYTVFETLNARGLELTTTDLLKNYLFSRISSQSDLDTLHRRWHRLVSMVRQEKFPEFLRYHYLTIDRQIRAARLFKRIRDEVKTSQDVFNLIEVLESRAPLFEALQDANHTYWLDYLGAKEWVRELILFRVRQMTPLLFAAQEKFSPEDFVRVLKDISRISFRYNVVSALNTNELEPVYHDAASSILNSQARTPAAVFERLRSIYVSDEKFESDFSDLALATSGSRKKLCKYILLKLESEKSGTFRDWETDSATIEHILPENPVEAWENSIPRDKWDDNIYRLGNLLPLEASLNRDAGHMVFDAKKEHYQRSAYKLAELVCASTGEEWTIEHIRARQRDLARTARHIWKSDFA